MQFYFNSNDVRVVVKNNEPWFVAMDVCKILDIKNSRDALSRLDDDEKGMVNTDTLGGYQELATVNESGLYSLIFKSRKAAAKHFKKWVTSEVLPSIRKTGGYQVSNPKQALNKDLLVGTGILDLIYSKGLLISLDEQLNIQAEIISQDTNIIEPNDWASLVSAVYAIPIDYIPKVMSVCTARISRQLIEDK